MVYFLLNQQTIILSYFKEKKVKRDLMFAHFGNGLSVADRLHDELGDYQKVAHIGRDRAITYYVDLEPEYKEIVEREARTSDPEVSHTQTDKVFVDRPNRERGLSKPSNLSV